MNLRRDLIQPDCERYRRFCNFTGEEEAVFNLCARGKSRVEIAFALGMSVSTVDSRIHRIKAKIQRVTA